MIYDIFSKRGKQLPDVYVYDEIPVSLRTQVVLILDNIEERPRDLYSIVVHILREEYCTFRLIRDRNSSTERDELWSFFLDESDTKRVLDVIEVSLSVLLNSGRRTAFYDSRSLAIANSAISNVNHRFREHGIGYEYVEGRMIRMDNEYTHTEIVKPALGILHRKEFEGAREEFLRSTYALSEEKQ